MLAKVGILCTSTLLKNRQRAVELIASPVHATPIIVYTNNGDALAKIISTLIMNNPRGVWQNRCAPAF